MYNNINMKERLCDYLKLVNFTCGFFNVVKSYVFLLIKWHFRQ